MAANLVLNNERAQLAVKAETTEGTAEALTNAEAGILVYGLNLSYDAPFEHDESVSDSLSPGEGTPSGPFVATLSFDMALRGSGTAGTAPKWDPLVEACGIDATPNAGVDEDWTLNDDQGDSVTIGWYVDGVYYQIHGARGDIVENYYAGKRAVWSFTMQGIYNPMDDVALLGSVTKEATAAPSFRNASLSFHGVSVKASQITINHNNKLELVEDPSATYAGKSYALVGKRQMTGSIQFSALKKATKDWYATWLAGTRAALSFNLGSAAGNTFAHSMPKCQITSPPQPGDKGGIHQHSIEFALTENTGSDEWTINGT